MNIVQDTWLPFRLKDGCEQVLPLAKICEPEVVDFALPRADFQGAAYQLAIGLLQTVFVPGDQFSWLDLYDEPPTESKLQSAFDTVAHAFNVTGEGPLFMQDLDALEEQKPTTVAGLLIEAPGANGIKHNTDHFIKRGIGEVMSLEMATLALFTLQINAPSGGVGHRVGLRGGGPVTTLVLPQNEDCCLWKKLWLNVVHRKEWLYDDPNLTDGSVFPWLESTKESSKKGSEIYQHDIHPLHMLWAMPRRIRLVVEKGDEVCKVSGLNSSYIVKGYLTKNYGNNYSGTWAHPLTPYKWDSKKPSEEHLSIKGQPGGINYKTWDVLTISSDEQGQACAKVVEQYHSLGREIGQGEVPRLWAFGYDLDNMKPRGWYSVTMPIFPLNEEDIDDILIEIKRLQSISNNALWHTRTQIKSAWFERPGEVKGDTAFIDLAFWQRSESIFFDAVASLIDNAQTAEAMLTPEQADYWLKRLRAVCMDLFDEYALSDLGGQRSMAKRIKARQVLTGWLFGGKEIKRFIDDYQVANLKDME